MKTDPVLWFRVVTHLLCAVPLARLAYLLFSGQLLGDPVQILTHATGWWALVFLVLSLTMTPLRLLTHWMGFLKVRRMLGLWSFAMASVHLLIYLVLDLQQEWTRIFEDIVKRPFITVGFFAWLILIPLAVTSNRFMMRKLGRNWGRLHTLTYAIAGLALLHFVWLVKKSITEPLIFAAIVAVLMLFRIPAIKSKLGRTSKLEA
jgi:methionine sulfoxide reductase heme-binding subunit